MSDGRGHLVFLSPTEVLILWPVNRSLLEPKGKGEAQKRTALSCGLGWINSLKQWPPRLKVELVKHRSKSCSCLNEKGKRKKERQKTSKAEERASAFCESLPSRATLHPYLILTASLCNHEELRIEIVLSVCSGKHQFKQDVGDQGA